MSGKPRPSKWERRYRRLQRATNDLYTAAFWTADRPLINERELWIALRDAAGIEEGTKTDFVFQGAMDLEGDER